MTLAEIGPVLLLGRWRGYEPVGIAEPIIRKPAGALRFVGVAFRSCGDLNCRSDNQRRGENGQNCLRIVVSV